MNANRIIELLGGNTVVAKMCNVSPQAVAEWKVHGIPHLRMVYLGAELERLSHGKISRKDICPNDWSFVWPELAKKKV